MLCNCIQTGKTIDSNCHHLFGILQHFRKFKYDFFKSRNASFSDKKSTLNYLHTLLPSPEPSLLAPSFDAKYTDVSENFLKGMGLRDWASKAPIIPKTGRQERLHVIPEREINHLVSHRKITSLYLAS